ncbi:MAG TPA: hypothetical protein DCL31_10825 [Clostridium sp.]|nr:hypothetical protein [Clostridium sp.]
MTNNSKTKKIIYILLGVMFLCFFLSGIIFLFSSNKNVVKNNSDNGTGVQFRTEKNLSIDNINNIDIDAALGSIKITSEDRKDVKLIFSYNENFFKNSVPTLNVNSYGTEAKIEIKYRSSLKKLNLGNSRISLEVYIPKSYNKSLSLDTKLGDINLNNLDLDNLECSLSMGKSLVNDINCNYFKYDNSMGDLNGDKVYTKESEIELSMGSANIKNFRGNLKAENSMGEIDIEYDEFNNNVDLEASMGSIKLTLPKKSEFSLSAKTSMGSVSCDFPLNTSIHKGSEIDGNINNSNNRIIANSSMGSIDIRSRD